MKKQEFKNLIKESVKEVLLEGGILSTIIAEVVKGLATPVVTEQKSSQKPPSLKAAESKLLQQEKDSQRQRLADTKRKMMEAIGKSSYGGIDIFEGTEALRGGTSNGHDSVLADVDPSGPGVDISALAGKKSVWKQLIKDKG
jgi:hypothetical protein